MAGIKSASLPREVSLATLWHPDKFDPVVLDCILGNDFVCAVCRAVTNNDPFEWPDGLRDHGFDRQFDKLRLISGSCYEHVRDTICLTNFMLKLC